MFKRNLTKTIALASISLSIVMCNSVGVSAKVTQSEAENLFYKNNVSEIWKGNFNNVSFVKEVSPQNSEYYTVINVNNIVDNQENLYVFKVCMGTYYLVGVDTGKTYLYSGGNGAGTFSWLDKDKETKQWYWSKSKGGWNQNNGWVSDYYSYWSYFKDGIVQTGWIYDGGNWYYCYSNGEMAHDTTIDGYYLGSNGAWSN